FGAVGAGEAEVVEGAGDLFAFLAGGDVEAGEALGVFGGFALGEMDDVDRGFSGFGEGFDGFVERSFGVGKFEGDGAFGGLDDGGGSAGEAGEAVGENGKAAHGGGHEKKAGLGESEEGDLPRAAAFSVGVVVE